MPGPAGVAGGPGIGDAGGPGVGEAGGPGIGDAGGPTGATAWSGPGETPNAISAAGVEALGWPPAENAAAIGSSPSEVDDSAPAASPNPCSAPSKAMASSSPPPRFEFAAADPAPVIEVVAAEAGRASLGPSSIRSPSGNGPSSRRSSPTAASMIQAPELIGMNQLTYPFDRAATSRIDSNRLTAAPLVRRLTEIPRTS